MPSSKETRALMIYLNNRVVLEALDDAERGKLTLALLDYLEYDKLPAFDGALGMAFLVLRKDVDRSVERWEEECARRSAAGKKSAALRAAKNFAKDVSCENDNISSVSEEEQEDVPRSKAQASSTALNTVEASSNTGTYTNPNPYQNPNTNSNSNPNAKSYSKSDPGSPPGSGPAAGARERDFARFWQAYPKKIGKQAARKAFLRAEVPLDTLLSALERQRGDPQWQRENGRFIPHPVTWLNQSRWEDEATGPSLKSDCGLYGVECL